MHRHSVKFRRNMAAFQSISGIGRRAKVIRETGKTSSELSDAISKDLKKHGMKFVGTTVGYAYLQAVGVIWSHEDGCFCRHEDDI